MRDQILTASLLAAMFLWPFALGMAVWTPARAVFGGAALGLIASAIINLIDVMMFEMPDMRADRFIERVTIMVVTSPFFGFAGLSGYLFKRVWQWLATKQS